MDVSETVDKFRGWLPIRVYRDNGRHMVDWCRVGTERLTQPFFEDSINVQMRRPFNLLFRHQTPIEFLGELSAESPGISPTGFIFHMSRCGSTLVSQMLASVSKNIVVSEPPSIDSVLRARVDGEPVGEATRADWLRWTVNAFGQRRNVEEQYLFIKFDSWSTIDLDLVRKVFPEVPWIFLYREPVEVMVSQVNQPGVHMVPGMVEGLMPDGARAVARLPTEEYCARLLAGICTAALSHSGDERAMFVNYSELPQAVTGMIASHFRAEYNDGEIAKMEASSRFNAKTPQLGFEPDSEHKRSSATDAIRAAAAEWLDPLYRRLEELRSRRHS